VRAWQQQRLVDDVTFIDDARFVDHTRFVYHRSEFERRWFLDDDAPRQSITRSRATPAADSASRFWGSDDVSRGRRRRGDNRGKELRDA
jgi:hypothetical protein